MTMYVSAWDSIKTCSQTRVASSVLGSTFSQNAGSHLASVLVPKWFIFRISRPESNTLTFMFSKGVLLANLPQKLHLCRLVLILELCKFRPTLITTCWVRGHLTVLNRCTWCDTPVCDFNQLSGTDMWGVSYVFLNRNYLKKKDIQSVDFF